MKRERKKLEEERIKRKKLEKEEREKKKGIINEGGKTEKRKGSK